MGWLLDKSEVTTPEAGRAREKGAVLMVNIEFQLDRPGQQYPYDLFEAFTKYAECFILSVALM